MSAPIDTNHVNFRYQIGRLQFARFVDERIRAARISEASESLRALSDDDFKRLRKDTSVVALVSDDYWELIEDESERRRLITHHNCICGISIPRSKPCCSRCDRRLPLQVERIHLSTVRHRLVSTARNRARATDMKERKGALECLNQIAVLINQIQKTAR